MIHGFTGTPRAFDGLKACLEKHGILVSAPLLPGHGTTPDELNRVHRSEWIDCGRSAYQELRRECDAVFFVGLSMGGALSLILAGETDCRGVVSLSAPTRFRAPWILFLPLLKRFFKFWRKRGAAQSMHSGEEGYDCYPLSGLSQMVRMLRHMRRRLPKVTCPALVMHARKDARVSSGNALRIFDALGSKEKTLVFLGYPCHVIVKGQDKDAVERDVTQFILQHARG